MTALKKKDDDMKAMEERYKVYLEKARNVSPNYFVYWLLYELICKIPKIFYIWSVFLKVIRALDPKLNPATAEIQALRNQLADRDKHILNLEVNPYYISRQIWRHVFS